MNPQRLFRLLWLMLSDAAESVVNLVAVAITGVDRLLHPQPIEAVGVGLAVSVSASLINLAVGFLLLRTGRKARSIVLEADGKHLMTDVWTSVGVNIVATGSSLVRRSVGGLMDRALGEPERLEIQRVLNRFERDGVHFHALRTRQAGSRAFLSVHVLVPGSWTVQRGHDIAEELDGALRERLPYATVFTHLEPTEDPRSFDDATLDRTEAAAASKRRLRPGRQ